MNPQLIAAFIECVLELEDLACIPEPSPEEKNEYRHYMREFANIFSRMVLEVQNSKLEVNDEEKQV